MTLSPKIITAVIAGITALIAALWLMFAQPEPASDPEDPVMAEHQDEASRPSAPSSDPLNTPDVTERETEQTEFHLSQIFGRWSPENEAFTLAIVPTSQSNRTEYHIEGHTQNRVWRGVYEKDPISSVQAQLYYLPRAEEMNADLPAWVRRKIDGELEWRIELIAEGPDHHPYLKMRWHRGFVKWDEASRSVSIEADRAPLEFDLHYQPLLNIEQYGTTHIDVFPAGAFDQEETPPPLGSVLQHQAVLVAVYMPERESEEVGHTLDISIEGTESGSTQTIELRSEEPVNGIVRYTHMRPISLGKCVGRAQYQPPVMSMEWIGAYISDGKSLGSCLPFSAGTGEFIRFSYKDASYNIQYYPSWTKATLVRQRDKIERYRKLYSEILRGDAPDTVKTQARTKLDLIKNYDALMELQVGDGDLLDIHRVAVGEIYLGGASGPTSYLKHKPDTDSVSPFKGLLFYTDEDLQIARSKSYEPRLQMGSSTMWRDALAFYAGDDAGHRAADASILAQNVVWQYCQGNPIFRPRPEQDEESQLKLMAAMNCFEQKAVYTALRHVGTQALNDIAKEFFVGVTYTLYEVSANVTSAGDIYTVFTGTDIYGKEVSDFEYWITAAGLALEAFGVAFEADDLYGMVAPKRHYRNVGGQIVRGADAVANVSALPRKTLGRNVNSLARVVADVSAAGGEAVAQTLDSVDDVSGLPASLSRSQKQQLARQFKPANLDVSPADLPDAAPRTRIRFGPPKNNVPGDGINVLSLQNELLVDYGPDAGLSGFNGSEVFSPTRLKAYEDAVAGNYMIWRATGKTADELTGASELKNIIADFVTEQPDLAKRVPLIGVTEPVPQAVLNRRLTQAGLEVTELPPTVTRAMKPTDVKLALDQGWIVETRLDFPGGDRAFIVEDILMDPTGVPVKVRGFDPKYGAHVDIDAAVFHKQIVRDGETSNFKLARASDPDKVSKRLPLGFKQKPARFLPWDEKLLVSGTPKGNSVFQFRTVDDNIQFIRLGEQVAAGRTNAIYRLPDFPDQLVRITKQGASPNEILCDLFGRNALADQALNPDIINGPRQRGVHRLKGGKVIEIIDVVKGTEARTLVKNSPDGKLTRGQALSLEAATRELNKAGYVWTDGHLANFAFEELPGNDNWRVQVFDPGGIFPMVGKTTQDRFQNARMAQRQIQIPEELAINKFRGNEDLGVDIARGDFHEKFGELIDHERMDTNPHEGLPVTPRIGLSQPIMWETFDMLDTDLRQALGR